jgi:hypothetical protein
LSMISSYIKYGAILVLGALLAGCASGNNEIEDAAASGVEISVSPETVPEPTPTLIPAQILPDLGPAPDIANEEWLNTDQPLNLAALRGKVVLLEFWTFG